MEKKRLIKGGTFMAIEYLGLSQINGPLVVLEGVKNASYEEIVEFHMDDGTEKWAVSWKYEDKAVIQVFEGTDNMSLRQIPIPGLPDILWKMAFPGNPGTYL